MEPILQICPITQPVNVKTGVVEFKAWLPQGIWFDFFNGRIYDGDKRLSLYRNLEHIPVLAKAGAIVPMSDLSEYTSSVANPEHVEVRVFAGANGNFHLWEDEGDTVEDLDEHWCDTEIILEWSDRVAFRILPARGNTEIIPEQRTWKLSFVGFADREMKVLSSSMEIAVEASYDEALRTLMVITPAMAVNETLEVMFTSSRMAKNSVLKEVFEFINCAKILFQQKEQIYSVIKDSVNTASALAALVSFELEPSLYGGLVEILTAKL